MGAYFLILFAYAGALSDTDSVALTSIPQSSLQACQIAGNQAKQLVSGTTKELKFICVNG